MGENQEPLLIKLLNALKAVVDQASEHHQNLSGSDEMPETVQLYKEVKVTLMNLVYINE